MFVSLLHHPWFHGLSFATATVDLVHGAPAPSYLSRSQASLSHSNHSSTSQFHSRALFWPPCVLPQQHGGNRRDILVNGDGPSRPVFDSFHLEHIMDPTKLSRIFVADSEPSGVPVSTAAAEALSPVADSHVRAMFTIQGGHQKTRNDPWIFSAPQRALHSLRRAPSSYFAVNIYFHSMFLHRRGPTRVLGGPH